MKTQQMLLVVSVLVLAWNQPRGWAQGKYVPGANEELFGTWTNDQNSGGLFQPGKLVCSPGAYRIYDRVSDSVPIEEGTMWIDRKWTDADGNVWYTTYGTNTSGRYKGDHWQELDKISKSGVWERELTTLEPECAASCFREQQERTAAVRVFDPKFYPSKIDPKDTLYSFLHDYRVLYRHTP